jgi:hypothetical protein
MSFVQRELNRIQSALESHPECHAEPYVAQQSLAWALEPTGFKAPFDLIVKGTREDSGDYSARSHPPLSSDSRADCVVRP